MAKDDEDVAMLCPETADHVLAQDEVGVIVELVVQDVGRGCGLISWVRLAKRGCEFADARC